MSVYFNEDEVSALNEMLGFIDEAGGLEADDEYKKSCVAEVIGVIRYKLSVAKYERVRKEEDSVKDGSDG